MSAHTYAHLYFDSAVQIFSPASKTRLCLADYVFATNWLLQLSAFRRLAGDLLSAALQLHLWFCLMIFKTIFCLLLYKWYFQHILNLCFWIFLWISSNIFGNICFNFRIIGYYYSGPISSMSESHSQHIFNNSPFHIFRYPFSKLEMLFLYELSVLRTLDAKSLHPLSLLFL